MGLGPAEESTPPATADAAGPTIGMGSGEVWHIGSSRLATAEARRGHRGRARREGATGWRGGGSLMRHAGATPGAVGPLPIPMIEPALETLLMALAGGAETLGAPFAATRGATVDVAAIAGMAEEEGLPAEAARPHQEDLHGPAGPEGSGGQWTSARECATTGSSRSRPRGVGAPEGLEGRAPGPHPSPSGVAAAYPKMPPPSTLSGSVSGFLRYWVSDNRGERRRRFRRASLRPPLRLEVLRDTPSSTQAAKNISAPASHLNGRRGRHVLSGTHSFELLALRRAGHLRLGCILRGR